MKIVLFYLFFCTLLYGLDRVSTLKIYQDIFGSIIHKNHIIVYTKNKQYQYVFARNNRILLSTNKSDADILLVTNSKELDEVLESGDKKIIFATRYSLIKSSDRVVGGLYKRKGRNQILFVSERLKRYDIRLPLRYKNYTIGKL